MSFCPRYTIYIQLCCFFLFFNTYSKAQKKIVNTSSALYGIFNNDLTLETRIIPIYNSDLNEIPSGVSNGFQILSNMDFSISSEWNGSATLAADPRSGLFFYASKSTEQQQIWAISSFGTKTSLNKETNQLSGHSLTKMAMGPDGYVYALSTCIESRKRGEEKETLLIRFKACNSPGCTKIENLGYISGKSGFGNTLVYSGDIAFSATGDLFIFGTELDSTINYYKGAHIYKITSAELKQTSMAKSIRIENMGLIAGMGVQTGIDSTIVTGVAFEQGGSFILSTVDKYTGSRVHFYRGIIQREITWVKPLELRCDIPVGFKITDLASFIMPPVNILASKKPVIEKITTNPIVENWEKHVTITKFNY
jgi:hypothetical protein